MKKILAVLCVTALLCGCSSNKKGSESSVVQGTTEAQTTTRLPTDFSIDTSYEERVEGTDTDYSSDEDVNWSDLYRAELEEFKASDKFDDTARFSIYDLNDDRVPELIISYGQTDDMNYLIRTLSERIYTEYDPIEHCSDLCFAMNRSLIHTYRYDFENRIQTVQLYRLKNHKLANVYTFQIDNELLKINNIEVTEKQYNDEFNDLLGGFIKPLGTDYGFEEDVIDTALGETEDWKEGFAAVLNDYLKNKKKYDDNHFSLMDINGDEIPELFVSGGAPYSPYIDLFSWNGCPVPVGKFGSDGTIHYYPDKNELMTEVDSPSYTAGSFYSFTEDYKIYEEFNYANNENSKKQDENVTLIYNVNNESIEKKDYESQVKEHKKGDNYVLGLDNDITEETIKALTEGKYTAPALAG